MASVRVGASAGAAQGTCVTHETNASAALSRTPSPPVRNTPGRAPRTSSPKGAVNLKKVLTWLIVAFVVFYVIQAPESSAQMVRNVGTALGNAASSLATFVGSIV